MDLAEAQGASANGSYLVGPGGDFDGDGQQDVALVFDGSEAAWSAQIYEEDLGRLDVLDGGGLPASDYSLLSVTGVPDVDGDGRDEMAVGINDGTGTVLMVYGIGTDDVKLRAWVGDTTPLYDGFGTQVVAVPDTNDDGVADLWVSVYAGDTEGKLGLSGAVLITSPVGGPSPLDAKEELAASMWLPDEGASFGGFVGGGDITGDGQAELMLGTAGDLGPNGPGVDPMQVVVYASNPVGTYSGPIDLQPGIETVVEGQRDENSVWDYTRHGTAISATSTVGDLNGDGCGDLVAGMVFDADARGSARIVWGCPQGGLPSVVDGDSPDVQIVGPDTGDLGFGWDVAVLPTFDGGEPALAVAHPGANRERGRVYVFVDLAQGTLSTVDAWFRIEGREDQAEGLGWSLANAGDVDGDGLSDLIVGEHGRVSVGPAVFLVFGGGRVEP